ncbi:MAG: hypothetical protein ACYTKD_26050 [Planctomycetota bacterium]|jgi:hypothetical protein
MLASGALSGAGTAALVAAAALILGTYLLLGRGVLFTRRALYACLRAVALGLVAFALAQPERTAERSVTRRHTLAVVVDDSVSLRFPLSPRSARTRLDALRRMLDAHADDLAALGERYDVAVYRFARELDRREGAPEGSSPLPLTLVAADGDATALGDAILGALDDARGKTLAGVLVISDGSSNLGASLSEAGGTLGRAGVPAHAISVGEALPVPDLSVSGIDGPREAPIAKPFRLRVRVRSHAVPALGASLVVRAAGEELGRKRVAFPAGDSEREVEFRCTPKGPGTVVIEAVVEPMPAEFVRANNRRVAFVEVRDSTLRVLYAEGVLRRDYRAIRRALGSAEGIDLDVARAFVRRPAKGEGVAGPRWDEHDVLVLGELPEGSITLADVARVRRLVSERARGLVVMSGPGALAKSPVRGLVPAAISNFTPAGPERVRPTAAGRAHPALRVTERAGDSAEAWSRLAALGDFPAAARPRPGAEALLETLLKAGVARPVLVAGRLGTGRVAAVLSGETHVWADDPDAPPEAYARLLRSLVTWAAGRESSSEVISVDVARRRVHRGDLVSIAARVNRTRAREVGLTDAEIDALELRAEVAGPLADPGAGAGETEGPPVAARLGLERAFGEYDGSLVAGGGGVYRARVSPAARDDRLQAGETLFTVQDDEREFARIEADPAALERLARRTGGVFARAEDPGAVFRALEGAASESVAVARRRFSLWDTWWVAALFLAALFAEWWMRRR